MPHSTAPSFLSDARRSPGNSARRVAHRLALAALPLALMSSVTTEARSGNGGLTAYVDGRWWTGERFERGDHYVRDGVFVPGRRRDAINVIDLHGGYVTPPFADAHQHVTDERTSPLFLARGIFYLKNPTVLASIGMALRKFLARKDTIDVTMAMGALTAPGGHPQGIYTTILLREVYKEMTAEEMRGQAFHLIATARDVVPALDLLKVQGADFVKVMLFHSEEFGKRKDDPAFFGQKGVDPALLPKIVAEAHKRGLKVTTHIETAADFRAGLDARVDEFAHMPGYQTDPARPQLYEITYDDARRAASLGIKVVTTALVALPEKPAERRIVQSVQARNLQLLKRAGVPILLGSDGGGSAAVLNEGDNLISLGVFDPQAVLKIAVEDTPRSIFPGRKLGRLRRGYEASFVVMAKDPSVDFRSVRTLTLRIKEGHMLSDKAPS